MVVMAREWFSTRLPVCQIPQAHRLVPIRRSECLSIRAEGHALHIIGIGFDRYPERRLAGHVPQAHRLVPIRRSECLSIRAEGHALHIIGIGFDRYAERPFSLE